MAATELIHFPCGVQLDAGPYRKFRTDTSPLFLLHSFPETTSNVSPSFAVGGLGLFQQILELNRFLDVEIPRVYANRVLFDKKGAHS